MESGPYLLDPWHFRLLKHTIRVLSSQAESCQQGQAHLCAVALFASQSLQVGWAPCRAVLTTTMCPLFTVVIDIGEECSWEGWGAGGVTGAKIFRGRRLPNAMGIGVVVRSPMCPEPTVVIDMGDERPESSRRVGGVRGAKMFLRRGRAPVEEHDVTSGAPWYWRTLSLISGLS